MDYPKPLVFEPLRLPHKQTFILLHGRGSSGHKFGPVLLETSFASPPLSPITTTSIPSLDISDSSVSPSPIIDSSTFDTTGVTLATAFPNARFVFPTAARRRATIYKRAYTRQWFDNWLLDPPATDREYLQTEGLRETVTYLHELLRAEIDLIPGGAKNVVFGGLSQGCAASLTALLLWEGDKLGAVIGMCGYLPFAETMLRQFGSGVEICNGGADAGNQISQAEDDFDPFDRDAMGNGSDEREVSGPATVAVDWLRDELQVSKSELSDDLPAFTGIPIFLGHGVQDERVSVLLGRRASQCLTAMNGRVYWHEFEGLGHWYSKDMLRAFIDFICKEMERE